MTAYVSSTVARDTPILGKALGHSKELPKFSLGNFTGPQDREGRVGLRCADNPG